MCRADYRRARNAADGTTPFGWSLFGVALVLLVAAMGGPTRRHRPIPWHDRARRPARKAVEAAPRLSVPHP